MTAAPRPLGGEMEISLRMLTEERPTSLVWPFARFRAVTSGRTGLALAAELLDRPGPVLLPSYLCASLVQPFREAGRSVAFYAVDERLDPDPEELTRRAEEVRPAAVVAIAYFGFPVSPAVGERLRALPGDPVIVEDCVQGSLVELPNPPVGHLGDVVVTSFRKYLPVPDGGLLIAASGLDLPELAPAPLDGVVGKVALAKALRALAAAGEVDGDVEAVALALFAEADGELGSKVPRLGMSALSARLLGSLDLPAAAARRRANYGFLHDAFASDPRLSALATPILGALPEGVSPLVFPVRVDGSRRDALRTELRRRRVFCPVHWPLPPEVDRREFPASHRLSEQILGLPIDQRYGEEEMASLVDRLLEAA